MAKTPGLSERDIERRFEKGCGQGRLSDYKPFLTVQDVSSKGRSHRVLGAKTNRIHHLLSDLELAVFLSLDWSADVTDIREQYPLQRDNTVTLAAEAGICHPEMGGVNQVMTSDFLVDSPSWTHRKFAIQVKYASDVNDARTVEKLELERRYWKTLNIPWFLITDRDVSKDAVANIKWLTAVSMERPPTEDLQRYTQLFLRCIQEAPRKKLVTLAQQLDLDYSLEAGEALYWLRILLSQRYLLFDVKVPYQALMASDISANSSLVAEGGRRAAG